MASSLKSLFRLLLFVLSWLPFLVFFSIISFMFLTDFQNPVDEYFVSLILKACLMLIVAALLSQILVLVSLAVWAFAPKRRWPFFDQAVEFLNGFPIVDIGIFSIAIFFTSPEVLDWIYVLCAFLLIPSFAYWVAFLKGPFRNLFAFARFHQVQRRKINQVMAPFYIKTFIDYFFAVLKRHLMPLVFILVVMDFRIILPRLVDAGLSYQAFVLFISLIISLHLLSYRQEAV